MKLLTPGNGHPVKYFVEPVIAVLNFIEERYNFSLVSMVGLSGGGWTTTLAAALDPRIRYSFPVAGSLPLFLRSSRDWGDYEQTVPELYQVTNYLELYVMGFYGEKRKQIQILNRYDPCCFSGEKAYFYGDAVKSRSNNGDCGYFDVIIDDSHREHKISKRAMEIILDEMSR